MSSSKPNSLIYLCQQSCKGCTTAIETILTDSNKENETNAFNSQKKEVVVEKQPESCNSSALIDVSNECLKEAFYFPKKLAKVYELYASPTVNERGDGLDNRAFTLSLPLNNYSSEINMENSHSFDDTKNQFIPPVVLKQKQSPYVLNPFHIQTNVHSQFRPQCLLMQQQLHYNAIMIPLHQYQQQLRALEIMNQEKIRNKENTEILSINIKVSENQYVMCKIRQFDDLFMTIKIFCEINQIESSFIRPLIVEVFCVLNSIYATMNTHLSNEDINYLRLLRIAMDKKTGK